MVDQQETIRVPLEPVTSSNLAAFGYDARRQILAVQFLNGQVWQYAPVSPEVAAEFGAADSKGRFYTREIRGRYAGQRMTGPCAACEAEGYVGDLCEDCGCASYMVVERTDKSRSPGARTRRPAREESDESQA